MTTITIENIRESPFALFGYTLTNDPKPGAKIWHAEVYEHIAFGLVQNAMPHIEAGTNPKDLYPLITIKYTHKEKTFEIEGPEIFQTYATQVTKHD